ncbi:hypothetical protein ASPZODRAFT_16006 [Penicilliopsis zonata CBS 506.65]|uniref:Sulfotransferase family protein n=1 Tax=Penicilliopsis zonata CBS 506.65 TaxID=1073090 RepID=A0A1L9SJR3_9EURO|nr:hypothetical protein ASPZODRAFT_16006 [Penicilliopsis zonata CBS 506.65]OJJ47326.1 hypothetical protein ASPZODRAFT_16006 [Penicilliopsis zonata CBS 506.65]
MSRHTDHKPNPRQAMRILGLGLARTGTNSMAIALRQLGYTPYHGSKCFHNPPHDFNLWIAALNRAYDTCLDIPVADLLARAGELAIKPTPTPK